MRRFIKKLRRKRRKIVKGLLIGSLICVSLNQAKLAYTEHIKPVETAQAPEPPEQLQDNTTPEVVEAVSVIDPAAYSNPEEVETTTENTEVTEVAQVAQVDQPVESEEINRSYDETSREGCQRLSASAGRVQGPSGTETYYNLDMSGVVGIMQDLGYGNQYWVRNDGVKMFGNYVMVAANFDVHPRGSLVETSLGTGIVCDTGGFAEGNPNQVDIATTW